MTALLAATALAGCSGSDDGDKSPADAKPGKSTASSSAPQPNVEKPCKATIQADGVSGEWKDAQVRVSEDHAVYTATAGDARLAVYSANGDSTASVNLYVKKGQYSTPPGDDDGLDVDGKGRSAKVDADLADVKGGDPVHVTATFTCAKGKDTGTDEDKGKGKG